MRGQHLIGLAILAATMVAAEPIPTAHPSPAAPVYSVPGFEAPAMPDGQPSPAWNQAAERGLLQSDDAFPGFIGPISNPILAKDPRSLTEARLLFIQNWIPSENFLRGGDFQVYAMQVRVALTERLTFIADKDGIATLSPRALPRQTGFLNINAGLKYTFWRDVETQTLAAAGFTYEPPTGEAKVFQNQGSGVFTVFGVFGKEIAKDYHVLANAGFQFPTDRSQNSSLLYTSLHVDRQLFGWLHPLAELNWYHYVEGGNRGLPTSLGEGDSLINFGTTGVAGQDLVTVAVGLKAQISQHINAGIAYETPISNNRMLLNDRILVELILRY